MSAMSLAGTVAMPSETVIRGVAMNSRAVGNGLTFRDEGVASLAAPDLEPINFVVDHSRSVRDIAGKVEFPLAEETPEGGSLLHFKATLSEKYPGAADAIRVIEALRSDGRIPNVSVSIGASDITFDQASGTFIMEPPYVLNHLGLVDVGAMSPKDGVGVFEVEQPGSDFPAMITTAPSMAQLSKSTPNGEFSMSIQAATVQVELSNRDDLVMKFMDAHGIDAPETIQLGLALGLDDPESTYVPSKPLPNDGSPEPKNGSTTMTEEKELNAVPKTQTGDTPAPSEPATAPAAPVVTAVGLSAEDKALIAKLSEDNKALEARLASIEKAGSEEKERRLSGARARVADLIGEDEDVALDGMDEAQLAFLEKTLKGAAARPAVLPMAGMSVPVTSQFAEKQKEAAAWHESVRFGKEKN